MSAIAAAVPADAASMALPALRLERLRFLCEALDPIRLPTYSGSAWRGLLGHSLRRSVCVTRAPTCEGCLLRQQCAYSSFFESPALPEQAGQRYRALPHPFVLEPPPAGQREHAPGEPLSLGITLIGPAAELLPYLIHALQRAGERGLGRENARFRLHEVIQETQPGSADWRAVYETRIGSLQAFHSQVPAIGSCPQPLQLELLTPLRIKQQGHYVRPDQLDARALLGTLATRIQLLAELYGARQPSTLSAPRALQPTPDAMPESSLAQSPPTLFERRALHSAIDQVQLDTADLRWVDWTRYSSRQRSHMQLGGLLGTVQLSGSGLAPLWPLIALGQWLHLGKNTSFGLGRYRVIPPAPSAAPGR